MSPSDAESSLGRPPTVRSASTPLPSVSLSREHITDALSKSPDNGITLDLTHKGLTDVGEDGAEELANVSQSIEGGGERTVVRIALAHNRLTTLPMAFALLSQLRYLVLKSNSFTVFPDVLTIMPSLEILDISRNKLKRLPSQPGSLTKLRVFSISRNRIHRLPSYFSQFRNLDTFKADQNPLEWPPKDVMEPPYGESAGAMREWIKSVQNWIEENAHTSERKPSDDQLPAEVSIEVEPGTSTDDTFDITREYQFAIDESMEPSSSHQRTFSLDSEVSLYSDILPQPGPSTLRTPRSPKSPRPPRLHLDAISTSRGASTSTSPNRSPESYLPTPDESVSSSEGDGTRSTTRAQPLGRNAPYSEGPRSPSRSGLLGQQSLPDMRPTKHNLGNLKDPPHSSSVDNYGLPSPPHRQESDSSNGSLSRLLIGRVFGQSHVVASPVSLQQAAPSMDGERNSYFRRLSTLNPSALSKSIPPALLKLVDAIRGILFGVCQIYQALHHYTVYAIDERLSAVLLKVLDPAHAYMNQLIHALDRFDTMSRKATPSPAVCRTVVEACRDNVTVFGKAVGMLALQLKVIATNDDARYTRQMLLVLYGAMAEISNAWQSMAGHLDAVKPLLREHRPPPIRAAVTPGMDSPGYQLGSARTAPSPLPTPTHRPMTRSIASTETAGAKTHVNRRHAGSFSSKDVEIGKMLPSYIEPPYGTFIPDSLPHPTLPRFTRRPSAPVINGGYVSNDGTIRPMNSAPRWDSHSRQSSVGSLFASAASSPAFGLRPPALDILSATTTVVDKQAIDAVRAAVEAAPAVWETTDELLRNDTVLEEELHEKLSRAKEITQSLRSNIHLLGAGEASSVDRRALRDDAHSFANVVIQLLSAIKTYGTTHPLTSALRGSMVTLTNATQEFVMLLHVSSFSPAPTPRPYSPMVSATLPQDDGKLGVSLSRSRSAVPPTSSKLATSFREVPLRSALPQFAV